MDTIDKDNKGCTDCMLDLVNRWWSEEDETGQLPRTWETVGNAVKGSGRGKLAMEVAIIHRVTLTHR